MGHLKSLDIPMATGQPCNGYYFFAADYLRLPKFSLTNSCIFRENTQFFTKIVVVGSGDRTTCPTPVPVFQVVKRLEL